MHICKRILQILFGMANGLTGIVSMMTAIFLITTNHEEFDDLLANTIMRVFFILFGEIFFAFGFGAMIVGVRFTFAGVRKNCDGFCLFTDVRGLELRTD